MLRVSRWVALPTMGLAVLFAVVRPEPGILLILAFDIVLAGCFVPLAMGLFWSRANAAGAVTSMVAGGGARLFLYVLLPEGLLGIDTLLAPVVALVVFVTVAMATQRRFPPRHEALGRIPSDSELVGG